MGNINHRHARMLIQGALDQPLATKEQARLDAHLAACSACRQYADRVRGLEDDLRRAMKQRWDERTGNFSPGAIQARSRRFRMQKTIWNMAKVLGGVALIVALFFLGNTFLRQPSTSESGTTATVATPAPGSMVEYQVQQGDTCASIADRFGIPEETLMQENGISAPCIVNVDQVLRIPATAATPQSSAEAMAGAWIATTDFGQITFIVDDTGARVTRVDYQFSNWTCGSTTFTLSEVMDNAYWPIADGAFTASPRSDLNVTTIMTIWGTYDTASQIFSGTWEEISDGTRCAGDWEASRAAAGTNADRAGGWTATTDFGRLFFTVDSTGTWITQTRLEFNPGWTCGSETDFDNIVNSGHWRIPNDEIPAFGSGMLPVDDSSAVHINVIWVYNPTSRIFFGRWEVDAGTAICKGDWVAALTNRASEYEVQEGDTCNSIAVAFYISKERLIEENNLAADCSDLYVGQTLRIPTPAP